MQSLAFDYDGFKLDTVEDGEVELRCMKCGDGGSMVDWWSLGVGLGQVLATAWAHAAVMHPAA